MINNHKNILRASSVIGLMLFLLGCATYNDRIIPYYKNVSAGNYKEAEKQIDKNKLIQKPRNRLLYLMEKGRICHLNGKFTESNHYFNEADSILEQGLTSVSDAAVGLFVNPMSQRYKGEDFEKFMIHYYKALNYVYLHNTEDAIVEARRISLQAQEQGDKFNNKTTRYSNDAFSLMFQGLLYESNKDLNNAFISYRNAVEIYLASPDSTYYGTTIPLELKKDVIRTATLNGFGTEAEQFAKIFGTTTYLASQSPEGGELIFFWENGLAPIKTQVDLFFSLIRDSNGSLFFTDALGGIMIPFQYNGDRNKVDLKSVESLRAAFPKYIPQKPYYKSAVITNNQVQVPLEKTEDITELANETLKQRTLTEMSKVLSRLAIKKIAEYSMRAAATNNGKTNSILEAGSYGIQLYSLLSEKADTRSWQSLPAQISYARIPLQKGENNITITLKTNDGVDETKTIKINGNGKLQFYNYATLH